MNFGLVSDWCIPSSLPDLHVGDRLEFSRTAWQYTHWGIYVGDWGDDHHQLVHIFSNKWSYGSGPLVDCHPEFCVESIWNIPGDVKVRINNARDRTWSPLDRTDILDEIECQLERQSNGHKLVFHLFSNNCENVVNHFRYGKHHNKITLFPRIRDLMTKDIKVRRHIRKKVTYQLKEFHEKDLGIEVYACRNQFKDNEDYCRYDRDHQHNYRRDNHYKRISQWHSKANIEGFIHKVCGGDRLEFRGSSPCERWGIYIGQWGDGLEQVVLCAHGHKTNSLTSTERLKVKPKLWVKSIRKHVVDGCYQVRINNEDDRTWPPFDRESILKEISHQLSGRAAGTHYECKVLFKDSEGFVNYCRYDHWHINYGLVSDWRSIRGHRMRVGDRLEFHRTAMPYTHWGIYVGDWGVDHHQVVHFAPADGNGKLFSKKKSSGSGSSAEDKPVLCVDNIYDVIVNDKVRINNERDNIWPPFVWKDILDEIGRQLKSQSDGHKPVYNVFRNNCEHFVNHCRYGRHRSDQVTPFSSIRYRFTKGQ